MVSGRDLLDEWTAKGLRVWVFNLEDPRDEFDRRITAAMLHHDVNPGEVGGGDAHTTTVRGGDASPRGGRMPHRAQRRAFKAKAALNGDPRHPSETVTF